MHGTDVTGSKAAGCIMHSTGADGPWSSWPELTPPVPEESLRLCRGPDPPTPGYCLVIRPVRAGPHPWGHH